MYIQGRPIDPAEAIVDRLLECHRPVRDPERDWALGVVAAVDPVTEPSPPTTIPLRGAGQWARRGHLPAAPRDALGSDAEEPAA